MTDEAKSNGAPSREARGEWDDIARSRAHKVARKARRRRAYYDEEGAPFEGWPTGLPGLDALTAGIPRSGLYLLSGAPGIGKTSLALQMASRVATKIPVAYLTFENNPTSLVEKLLCSRLGVDVGDLRRGLASEETIEEIEAETKRLAALRHLRVLGPGDYPNATGEAEDGWTIGRLEKTIDNWLDAYGDKGALNPPSGFDDNYGRPECLVVVDYLQHWAKRNPDYTDLRTARQQVERMSAELTALGPEGRRVAVLAIASQNRKSGYGRNSRSSSGAPQASLTSLKESGDLEYMADVVMILTHGLDYVGGDGARQLSLQLLKNRYGSTGEMELNFNPATGAFWEQGA